MYMKGTMMITLLSRIFIKNHKQTDAPEVRLAYGTLCSVMGIILNLVLFGIKAFAGYLSGSVAIIADATNNLLDSGSSIVTLIGFKISAKKPDASHPFGHGRSEHIAGLIISFLIINMGIDIAKSSFSKIFEPGNSELSAVTLIILIASIVIKLYMAYYNRSIGKKIKSSSVQATATDSICDCISTVVVLVSLLISYFTSFNADGYCGLAVALFIIISGIRTAKETVSPLLGNAAPPEIVDAVEKIVMSYPEVLGIHDFIAHDYGNGMVILSLHAEVDAKGDILKIHDTIDNIERHIGEEISCIVTIHMDPVVTDDPLIGEMKSFVSEKLKQNYSDITAHDFRIVNGETHTNVIFDIVVPFEYKHPEQIATFLKEEINKKNSKTFAVINIDSKYS